MGRPVPSDIPAERASSRLSTAGGKPAFHSPAQRERTADTVLETEPIELVELGRRQSQLDNVSVRLPIGIVDST